MNRAFWLHATLASLVIALTLSTTPAARAQDVYLPGAETIPPPKDSTLTIRVRPLAPGVFAAKVNFVWTGWVELSDGILVIDATFADSTAAALADTIAARSPGKKIRYLVLTHDHVDHMGGARRFLDAGAVLIAQKGKVATIDSLLGRAPAKGDVGVSKRYRIVDKKSPVDVIWLGRPAHSAGDVVVLVPRQKILFAGDLVSNRSVPWLLDHDLSLDGWSASLDSLYAMRAGIDSLVPGHGDLAPPADGIRFTMRYLREAQEKAAEIVAAGVQLGAVARWSDMGAYQGLEFYEEVQVMNIRRLYKEAKGIKTPGRVRVGTYRK
jgi:cyclase